MGSALPLCHTYWWLRSRIFSARKFTLQAHALLLSSHVAWFTAPKRSLTTSGRSKASSISVSLRFIAFHLHADVLQNAPKSNLFEISMNKPLYGFSQIKPTKLLWCLPYTCRPVHKNMYIFTEIQLWSFLVRCFSQTRRFLRDMLATVVSILPQGLINPRSVLLFFLGNRDAKLETVFSAL
jgi:hypothetical protein